MEFGHELDLDPDHDERLRHHLGGESRQDGQHRRYPGGSARRGGRAGRALDQRVGDLVGRLAGELHLQRRLVTDPQPRRHRDHLSHQVAGARIRSPPHRRSSRPRALADHARPASGRARTRARGLDKRAHQPVPLLRVLRLGDIGRHLGRTEGDIGFGFSHGLPLPAIAAHPPARFN